MNARQPAVTGRRKRGSARAPGSRKTIQLIAAFTPKERKELFAQNLDQLLKFSGLNRKEAAEEIGLPYKLVRRLASAGVSRIDERNRDSLQKIADYFALVNVDELWVSNMVPWLLTEPEGRLFVEKFRSKLVEYRRKQSRATEQVDHEVDQLMAEALGEDAARSEQAVFLDKTRAILCSERAEQFERLIDDYYELAVRTKTATG